MESRAKKLVVSDEEPEVIFEVTYSKEFEQLIIDGNYGFVSRYFKKTHVDIPPECIDKKIKVKAKLFKADCHGVADLIILKIEKEGYRIAVFHELLALGIASPDLQKKFTIVALGSVKKCFWIGLEKVPCLRTKKGIRNLELLYDMVWQKKEQRFLAIKIEK